MLTFEINDHEALRQNRLKGMQGVSRKSGRVAPDDAENPSSTAMSASCSGPMTWLTVASLDIGRAI
tara:strand:+ start:158 stop:355 length:198 start_codon:yes stop_codon:yes gene_type:complete